MPPNEFKWKHFAPTIILWCLRWYGSTPLSYANVSDMLAERGIPVVHATRHRWILRLVPVIANAARRYKRPVSQKWQLDETYIKIKGQWSYLYRAIDSHGHTVDFLLTRHRDIRAAKRFFKQAISQHPCPITVTMDKSDSNRKAVDSFNAGFCRYKPITVRQNKYLNNRIEQDHRFIKRLTRAMLGFKTFHSAKILLAGIELIHMFRKG